MQDSKKRHRYKEQTFGLCGEGEGGMISDNSIDTFILLYANNTIFTTPLGHKQRTS